jgi:hypothetical protein
MQSHFLIKNVFLDLARGLFYWPMDFRFLVYMDSASFAYFKFGD